MCGRTVCMLAPDDVVRACSYRDKQGRRRQPQWKDAPGGKQYTGSCNMAPTQHCPVLISNKQYLAHCSSDTKKSCDDDDVELPCERVVIPMKWGITPPWHSGDPYKVPYETNNCRVEGMMDKKTYKVPLHRGQRCVVLMDGFYEWKTSKDGKQPYFFHFPQSPDFSFYKKFKLNEEICSSSLNIRNTTDKDEYGKNSSITSDNKGIGTTGCVEATVKNEFEDVKSVCRDVDSQILNRKRKLDQLEEDDVRWEGQRLLTVAGVYDKWQSGPNSPPLYSYSVITVPASDDFQWCHHRMPAVLYTDEEVQDWIDSASVPLQQAASLLRPTVGLSYYPVSKAVGNSRYKEPDCVKPVELSQPKPNPSSNFMKNWLTGSKKN